MSDNLQQYFAAPDNGLCAKSTDDLIQSSTKYQKIELECKRVSDDTMPNHDIGQAAEDEVEKTGQPKPSKELPAKIRIGSYEPSVQVITWLALRKKYDADKVFLQGGGMKLSEVDEALLRWRDPDGLFILVASIAFAENLVLTEASTVIIIEPQDRQNTQDQFMFRVYRLGQLAAICIGIILYTPESELEVGVLSKQFVKTVSRDGLQGETTEGGEMI